MKILEAYLDPTHINRPKTPLKSVRSYVFHYTANASPYATALANAKYFARAYEWGKYRDSSGVKEGWIEKGSSVGGIGKKFGYGSTQVIVDMEQVVLAIPLTEKAYAVGDGSTPLAIRLFSSDQNNMTINVEICNNDVIPNSTADWDKACLNAIEFVANDIVGRNTNFNYKDPHAFLRHYDISGKICPAPFVDLTISAPSPKWLKFKEMLLTRIEELIAGKVVLKIPAPIIESPVGVTSRYFKDVPLNHYAITYIDRAFECGIIKGVAPDTLGFSEDLARLIVMQIKTIDYIKTKFVAK